ncbi:MAG TPA: LysR family transcriptional regulator [Candidatus Angelobacter sp.]|nr:LysR family transcriptional regulator [Candidatus Angelobacter sp.]
MDLRLLRFALALADHGSFARAANAVHISQPAFSRAIKELERQVGTLLFERGKGTVKLTDAGGVFLGEAREVASRAAELARGMELLRGLDAGELHVGVAPYPAATLLGPALARLVHEHPSVRLRVTRSTSVNLPDLLRSRELDVALMNLDEVSDDAQLSLTRLHRHQGYLVVRAGHPWLASREPLSLADAFRFPIAAPARISPAVLKRVLEETFGKNGVSSEAKSIPSIACDSMSTLKTITAGSDTVSVMTLSLVMPEVRAGSLVVLPLVVPWLHETYALGRLARCQRSAAAESLIQMLIDEDRRLFEFEQRAEKELFRRKARVARSTAS